MATPESHPVRFFLSLLNVAGGLALMAGLMYPVRGLFRIGPLIGIVGLGGLAVSVVIQYFRNRTVS